MRERQRNELYRDYPTFNAGKETQKLGRNEISNLVTYPVQSLTQQASGR